MLWVVFDNFVKRCDNSMIDFVFIFIVVNRVRLLYRIYLGLGGEGFLIDFCFLKECIDRWEIFLLSSFGR